MAIIIDIGAKIQLKKPHPCGSYDWIVTRLGSDIGLLCVLCNRRIMLSRSQLDRRIKEIASNNQDSIAGA